MGPRGDCRQRCAYPIPHCLTRNYDRSSFSTFYDHKALDMLLNDLSIDYDEFRQWIEAAPHGRVHASVGGEGGDMTSMQSPNDPIFWLHHSMIDKLWNDYQKKGSNLYKCRILLICRFGGIHNGRSVSLRDNIMPFNIRIRDVMDISTLCYDYQPFSRLSSRMASSAAELEVPIQPPDALPEHWIAMINAPVDVVREQERKLTTAMISQKESFQTSSSAINYQLSFCVLSILLLLNVLQ